MKKYVLDTNLYIRAFRSEEAAEELRAWYALFAPVTYLNAIVLHEILVGANSPTKTREVEERIASPFKRTGRLITPSAAAWESAAIAVARMSMREKRDLRSVPKSLMNDYLLAASCRDAGVTLVTDNVSDFQQIRRYVKVDYEAAWPT